MTKRQQKAEARMQEKHAVALYLKGYTLREIKRITTVDGFIVRGLVCAHVLGKTR